MPLICRISALSPQMCHSILRANSSGFGDWWLLLLTESVTMIRSFCWRAKSARFLVLCPQPVTAGGGFCLRLPLFDPGTSIMDALGWGSRQQSVGSRPERLIEGGSPAHRSTIARPTIPAAISALHPRFLQTPASRRPAGSSRRRPAMAGTSRGNCSRGAPVREWRP